MIVKMKAYRGLPCSLSVFVINGVQADMYDFGRQNRTDDGYWGCSSNIFTPFRHPGKDCLSKYKISLNEFLEIGDRLEKLLNIHDCNWCN